MGVEKIPAEVRTSDFYTHIDMGFVNRRLGLQALGPLREQFLAKREPGEDHFTQLANDHLMVTMLLEIASSVGVPSLAEAVSLGEPTVMVMSTERLEPCPDVYEKKRVRQKVLFDLDLEKPVYLEYHTEHIVADTGRMVLADGFSRGYREAILGVLHDQGDYFWLEPIAMGAPWLDHQFNKGGHRNLMWFGRDYGEVLPEDIAEFERLKDVAVSSAEEWMSAMRNVPEAAVKSAIASLLSEPEKKDWGGEENDHFSSNVTVGGRRRTAAFLLKGPTSFREMTIAMCGANGDQIYRLDRANADINVVQHAHLIGTAVRETVRAFTVTPGRRSRKFCIMDGQATYRLLKAYEFLK